MLSVRWSTSFSVHTHALLKLRWETCTLTKSHKSCRSSPPPKMSFYWMSLLEDVKGADNGISNMIQSILFVLLVACTIITECNLGYMTKSTRRAISSASCWLNSIISYFGSSKHSNFMTGEEGDSTICTWKWSFGLVWDPGGAFLPSHFHPSCKYPTRRKLGRVR